MKNKTDKRYAVEKGYCGYKEKRYVVRFCGEYIGQGERKSDAAMIIIAHKEIWPEQSTQEKQSMNKSEITFTIPVSKTRFMLREDNTEANTIANPRLRTYATSAILREMIDTLPTVDKMKHTNVVHESRSKHTLTVTEYKTVLASAILNRSATASHNRGKMPNSYRYAPTSQCVSVSVVYFKTKYRVTVRQERS